MLYFSVKYVHPLVLSLGHPCPHPTGPLASTSRISLKFKSILFLQVPSLFPPHPGPNCRHCHLHTLPGSHLKMLIFFFHCFLTAVWNQIMEALSTAWEAPCSDPAPLHLYLVPCASLLHSAFHPCSEAPPRLFPSAQDSV